MADSLEKIVHGAKFSPKGELGMYKRNKLHMRPTNRTMLPERALGNDGLCLPLESGNTCAAVSAAESC